MSKNPQIGTCPCPFTDIDPATKKERRCSLVMAVRRFECKAPDALQRRRKGGKLYADCPTHGRIGFDGVSGTQEYLLNTSELWDAKKLDEKKEQSQHSTPTPAVVKTQRSPVPAPAKTSATSSPTASTHEPKKPALFEW